MASWLRSAECWPSRLAPTPGVMRVVMASGTPGPPQPGAGSHARAAATTREREKERHREAQRGRECQGRDVASRAGRGFRVLALPAWIFCVPRIWLPHTGGELRATPAVYSPSPSQLLILGDGMGNTLPTNCSPYVASK